LPESICGGNTTSKEKMEPYSSSGERKTSIGRRKVAPSHSKGSSLQFVRERLPGFKRRIPPFIEWKSLWGGGGGVLHKRSQIILGGMKNSPKGVPPEEKKKRGGGLLEWERRTIPKFNPPRRPGGKEEVFLFWGKRRRNFRREKRTHL